MPVGNVDGFYIALKTNENLGEQKVIKAPETGLPGVPSQPARKLPCINGQLARFSGSAVAGLG